MTRRDETAGEADNDHDSPAIGPPAAAKGCKVSDYQLGDVGSDVSAAQSQERKGNEETRQERRRG